MITDEAAQNWAARPVQAWLIRIGVFLLPIAGSIVFVSIASRIVTLPTSSFVLFAAWWLGMSAAATVVLVGIERGARRLLPLVALYKLSLVFPDAAPSRFKTAMRSGTVETLGERVARARAMNDSSTPVEAAQRLLVLVSDLDSHDRLTRGHSERVRAYARLIGQELHLSAKELDLLNWAALLHDVGKLNVATEILAKQGQPTAAEWDILHRHPEFGEELTESLREWLGPWWRSVGEHHERWDGQGYPRGLSGDEIALAGRIVAVADVFDVITSARSYKSPFASTTARNEIASCAGTQFDPRVVRAFLNISIGRLRLVMGPLSWLAHVPVLARLPLTPAIGTFAASVATVATALTAGLVASPPTSVLAGTVKATPGVIPAIERVTAEDESVLVGVEQAAGGARVRSLRLVAPPAVGRAKATGGRRVLFVPPPDFNGGVSMAYRACWVGHGCRRGAIHIEVLPVNDPPVARDDEATTDSGTEVSVDVLANDTDVEGHSLVIVSATHSTGGRARIVDRRIVWTPSKGFAGVASFDYGATDGHNGRAQARVRVRVTQAASAPQPTEVTHPPAPTGGGAPTPAPTPAPANVPPHARPDAFTVPEGGTAIVDVLANDRDSDGDPISLAAVGAPSEGATERVGDRVRFTAPADSVGRATFPYTIADSSGAESTANVTVSVLLVNDPPSFVAGVDQVVLEDSGARSVALWASGVSAGPGSESGQSVSFVASSDNAGLFGAQPAVATNGTLSFTPAADAFGSATVTVRVVDDGGTASGGLDTSAPQTFTITVTAVNDPPVANPDGATVNEDDLAGVTFAVLTNDTDADVGDTLSVSAFDDSALTGGTLTDNGGGSFTYVPGPGFGGTDAFSYTASDGNGGTSIATVTLTVTALPDAPDAASDGYTTPEDTTLVVSAPGVLGNDADEDEDVLTVQTTPIVSPTNGVLTLNSDGSFTYVPSIGFAGTDFFTYRVDDGTGLADDAVVTITVSSTVTLSSLYFVDAGPLSTIWGMTFTPPGPASPVPDYETDGDPGLTIKSSGGSESETDPEKFKAWSYLTVAPLVLNGPVTLRLWSTIAGFQTNMNGHPHVYLYDCIAGGVSCVKIAENDVHVDDWNGTVSSWVYQTINVGSVDRTIAPGRALKVVLLFEHEDLWIAMTAVYPSGLTLTLG